MAKNTICLWYDKEAEAAARFYAETFPDSVVGAVHRAPSDYPSGKEDDVLTVEFTVAGIPCLGLNGGPAFKHNEAFSFQVATADQAETDRYWNAIVGNGGEESACGWCKDKWGVSWQITPVALTKAITDPDPAAAKRAFGASRSATRISGSLTVSRCPPAAAIRVSRWTVPAIAPGTVADTEPAPAAASSADERADTQSAGSVAASGVPTTTAGATPRIAATLGLA